MSLQTRKRSLWRLSWHPQCPQPRMGNAIKDILMSIAMSWGTWRCSTKWASKPRPRYRRHQAGHVHVNLGRLWKHSDVSGDVLANVKVGKKPLSCMLTWPATSIFPASMSDATSDSTSPLDRMTLPAMWHCPSFYCLGVLDVAPSGHSFHPPKISKNPLCYTDVQTFFVMSPRVTACYTR